MRSLLPATLLLAVVFITPAAEACTVCHSRAGSLLRAGLFAGHFFPTLGLVLLPCPVLVLAILLIHFAVPLFPVASGDGGEGRLRR